ncbi:hypothetical protein B484DRAFT_405086 [Ochromonadaceae sp. CCMP2298]|nr:hypothetical protein B484DRAFT_405086 [Ochromonadaceae sp. CCMP2298]
MALTFWHTTYPLAPHMPTVANDFLVLMNFVKMLREGRDRHDVPAILDGYAQSIFITSPTGRPEPLDVTHTCCFDQAHYHTTPHDPNHPAVSVWADIQACMLSDMTDTYVTPSTTWGTAPALDRLENIAPDFSTTNLLPTPTGIVTTDSMSFRQRPCSFAEPHSQKRSSQGPWH